MCMFGKVSDLWHLNLDLQIKYNFNFYYEFHCSTSGLQQWSVKQNVSVQIISTCLYLMLQIL